MHPLLLKSRFSIAFCYIEFRLTLLRSSYRYRLYFLKGLFSARFGYIGFRPSGSLSCGPRVGINREMKRSTGTAILGLDESALPEYQPADGLTGIIAGLRSLGALYIHAAPQTRAAHTHGSGACWHRVTRLGRDGCQERQSGRDDLQMRAIVWRAVPGSSRERNGYRVQEAWAPSSHVLGFQSSRWDIRHRATLWPVRGQPSDVQELPESSHKYSAPRAAQFSAGELDSWIGRELLKLHPVRPKPAGGIG